MLYFVASEVHLSKGLCKAEPRLARSNFFWEQRYNLNGTYTLEQDIKGERKRQKGEKKKIKSVQRHWNEGKWKIKKHNIYSAEKNEYYEDVETTIGI